MEVGVVVASVLWVVEAGAAEAAVVAGVAAVEVVVVVVAVAIRARVALSIAAASALQQHTTMAVHQQQRHRAEDGADGKARKRARVVVV